MPTLVDAHSPQKNAGSTAGIFAGRIHPYIVNYSNPIYREYMVRVPGALTVLPH